MSDEQPLRCPNCGSREVHLSQMRQKMDPLMRWFGLAPYRCRICGLRFYEHERAAEKGGAAAGKS